MKPRNILGIDPGLSGAFVLTDGRYAHVWAMPIETNGKDKQIHFDGVRDILSEIKHIYAPHVFIERAVPMAMGSKHAFNYGRGFAALEIALFLLKLPTTYVEPQKWTKEMHEGISMDLRPKAKSVIAAKRLFPKLVGQLPKDTKGKIKDGPIDALLIAGYGLRKNIMEPEAIGDFY